MFGEECCNEAKSWGHGKRSEHSENSFYNFFFGRKLWPEYCPQKLNRLFNWWCHLIHATNIEVFKQVHEAHSVDQIPRGFQRVDEILIEPFPWVQRSEDHWLLWRFRFHQNLWINKEGLLDLENRRGSMQRREQDQQGSVSKSRRQMRTKLWNALLESSQWQSCAWLSLASGCHPLPIDGVCPWCTFEEQIIHLVLNPENIHEVDSRVWKTLDNVLFVSSEIYTWN